MRRIAMCLLGMCVLTLTVSVGAQKPERRNFSMAADFAIGNIVVCRVGDGSSALSNAAAPVFLDEYNPAGTLISSTAMPTVNGVVQKAFTVAGTSTTECHLNRSTDGRYLVLAGYAQTPTTGTVSSSIGPRVLARVDSAGNVDTSTTTDSFGTSAVRAAAATDGTSFWATGSGGGLIYKSFGTIGTGTVINSVGAANHRGINIFDGQLYTSSQVSGYHLGTVGTGIPTTGPNTPANLPGFPTGGSPQAFFFADLEPSVAGVDTLYVADNGAAGTPTTTANSGGLKKFSLVSGSWVFNGGFPASVSPAIGASSYFGVTGQVNGTQVTLYASRISPGQLVRFVDSTGYNGIPVAVPTLVATVSANTAFRGVAFAPALPVVAPGLTIDDVSLAEGNAGTTAYTFTVTLSAPAPAGGVTFDIATADGTAQDDNPDAEDADYTSNWLTGQTIPAGATSYQFTVNVNGDAVFEPNESFFVNVTSVVGATVTDGQGQGTVVNDDLAPTAGPVTINGRVLTHQGRGIANAAVTLTDANGATFHARTNSFGYYRFEAVPGGESYVMVVRAKSYRFFPRLLTTDADVAGLNIYPEQ